MNTKDIVTEWLYNNGFDGLYCEACGCSIDDLMPCGGQQSGIDTCKPGYKHVCSGNCSVCLMENVCEKDWEEGEWFINQFPAWYDEKK